MSKEQIKEAIERELAAEPLRANELVRRIAEQADDFGNPNEDSIRVTIWELVESYDVLWEVNGLLAIPQTAQHA